ncbi:glycosyltransferase [Corynebacterium qintianiae]|uniref:Glycosyltransferase n=1 Tax=Corynebacterium qintianiae TaxID=2709392 RepID=A0A7T0KM59_9CORY|nr:glycosyltransferase [Corynebacterium qintianiae]QPK82780.1 glycosyltransferase [Corynebacterium qintianiae]
MTSEDFKRHLEKRFSGSTEKPSPPIFTVRNVFPMESSITFSERREGDRGSLKVLYAGTIGRAQNLANSIEAAALAIDQGADVRLRFVGNGAGKDDLTRAAKIFNVPIELADRVSYKELSSHYQWADTALVHLTDWPALRMTVPSKTYELMESGIHITGVVDGETKGLIEALGAGVTVSPENPEQLAVMFLDLFSRTQLSKPDKKAAEWVRSQREVTARQNFLVAMEAVLQCSK